LPVITQQPASLTVPAGQSATFSVVAIGDSLTYQWQRYGVNIPGATSASYTLPSAGIVDQGASFRVIVNGVGGILTSNDAILSVGVGGQAPTPVIKSPRAGQLYVAGKRVKFKGTATDPQGGRLKPSAFHWSAALYHDGIATPGAVVVVDGKSGGSFKVPRDTAASPDDYIRIELSVISPTGQSAATSEDLHPRTAQVTVDANHPGLHFNMAGAAVTAPVTFTAVVGSQLTLTADPAQVVDGVTYTFQKWSKGRKADLSLAVAAKDQVLQLTYVP
jgi:hypothetical protein